MATGNVGATLAVAQMTLAVAQMTLAVARISSNTLTGGL
jgi:hypothetical protein